MIDNYNVSYLYNSYRHCFIASRLVANSCLSAGKCFIVKLLKKVSNHT